MRLRTMSVLIAAVAVMTVSGCAASETGSAVAGTSTVGTSAAVTSAAATSTAATAATTTTTAATTSTATSAAATSAAATSAAATTTTAATTTAPAAIADVWPTEVCKLMPGELTQGLTRAPGDPQVRCSYEKLTGGDYLSVSITRGSGHISPDEPGSARSTQVRTAPIDGRPGWSWEDKAGSGARAAFDSGSGSAVFSVTGESMSYQEKHTKVLALATAVSKSLRSTAPMSGAVTALPSTTHQKVPAGTRAWPHVICEVMPQHLVDDVALEQARGHEDEFCRLTSDTGTVRVEYEVRRQIGATVHPSTMGPTMQQQSLDGRTVYSYLSDNVASPTAYVEFDTGRRESAVVRVTQSDVSADIDTETVRKAAIALAGEIAPRLPRP